jgi:hypothetical protein
VLLFRLGRRWLDPMGTAATVAIFAVFSYSLAHAASFRIDGLLLPFLLGHALLLSDPSRRRVVTAGAVFGIALALSIKAALWAPMTAGLLVWWIWTKRMTLPIAAASIAATIATFGVCLLAHQLLNAPAAEFAQAPRPATGLSPVASYMFMDEGLLPRAGVLGGAVVANFVTTCLMISGALLAILELRSPQGRARALPLLLLATPALAIIFYANAWHYAYVTLIPTACLLAGFAVSRFARLGHRVILLLILGVSVPLIGAARGLLTDGIEPQREVVSTVHALFPQPVPYIDYTGMISSFPRRVFLMTRLGRKGYLERGNPLVTNYIAEFHPPLLIVNLPSLDVWEGGLAERVAPELRLLSADEEALRETYAPYWGPIYLAGKDWRDLEGAETLSFEMAIPGDYTLISDRPVRVDGETLQSGETIALVQGRHILETMGRSERIRLLWGKGVKVPSSPPSPLPIYVPA